MNLMYVPVSFMIILKLHHPLILLVLTNFNFFQILNKDDKTAEIFNSWSLTFKS